MLSIEKPTTETIKRTTSGSAPVSKTATVSFDGKSIDLPVTVGTENEVGIDIAQLRAKTGWITLDDGYGNTGACTSDITFIDGEAGILRYRGYPIEELAEKSTFVEVAYLLLFGELPSAAQLQDFRDHLTHYQFIHEDLRHTLQGFPPAAPPMAILSAMITAAGCFEPALMEGFDDHRTAELAARVMSRVRTIAAAAYKKAKGRPMIYPKSDLPYVANFLHMMFSKPYMDYQPDPEMVRALDQIFILHADHEQNCSTSTVRMVGSAKANLWASIAAGVCALWGPLHGGANMEVIDMLTRIHQGGESVSSFMAKVKDKTANVKLMGFGHRVYKNFDPRAKIIKTACDRVLAKLGIHDPLLDIAKQLEEVALRDSYFVERKLYPNVDFYSGIIMRAMGIPTDMFTVMFAIGRIPGWISHWREVNLNPNGRINRPRQIYTGPTNRAYVPIEQRPK
ncbi:MAG: citrate synthase [Phycisphaerales bacterium]|nr:citrate synthase [Phycisphaerales bacterium]